MAKGLHHKAARYEVQTYQPNTISWRPVYHTNVRTEAMAHMEHTYGTGKVVSVRVLDRVNGPSKATIVAWLGSPEINRAYGK